MSAHEYVEQIKKMINALAVDLSDTNNIALSDFEIIFEKVKANIPVMAPMIGLPIVDEISLRSYFELARKEYLSINPTQIDPADLISKSKKKSWLTSSRNEEITWNYTERYLRHLKNTGRSKKIINETERSSIDIVSKLGDPSSPDEFYVKGLVVGEVQSGKTGNFNAVINRAVDSGYGLIIILSGIMEDLRSQTQQRIESDVIGEGLDDESGKKGKKGVGNITRFGQLGNSEIKQVVSITSAKSDFKKSLVDAEFSLNHTNILVCKKNVSVLRNLIVWLHDFVEKDKDKLSIPFLIIDDEADNASLNNEGSKGHEYASKINGHIRALLQLFHKKSYLGYTASPFANVLQDRNEQPTKEWSIKFKVKGENQEKLLKQVDNIFPDDFIYLLNSPSNYIGAKQIFETLEVIDNKAEGEKIPLIASPVDDYIPEFPTRVFEDGEPIGITNYANKKEWDERVNSDLYFSSYSEYKANTRAAKAYDDFPKKLPQSLKESVICFILSIAIRDQRKPDIINSALYQPHHTMLIHISRFTLWQNTTSKLVDNYLSDLSDSILNDNPSSSSSRYSEIEKVWYKYYAEIVESIRKYLPSQYSDEFLTPMVFESIKGYLPEAVKGIEVKAINSITKQKLEYSKITPKKYIAIGGNRLSRGFTLEGLTINYFIRNTNYSDTLLQMGRWFGYRPGYIDCCKLFTTEDAILKYNQTTKCIEELEHEFKKMSRQGSTPENFVLRVKKHPGVLKITRPSILKNTKDVKWSYQDQLEMTTLFDVTKIKIDRVWNNFKDNVAPKLIKGSSDGFLSYEASGLDVINLLESENNFSSEDVSTMVKFIRLCNKENKLKNWTIALKTTGSAKDLNGKRIVKAIDSNLVSDVELSIRRGPSEKLSQEHYRKRFLEEHKFHMTGKNANILSSSKDLSARLSEATITRAENQFYDEKVRVIQKKKPSLTAEEARKEINTIPERVYREEMGEDEAVLVIYLFDSKYSFNHEENKEDLQFQEYVKANNIDLNIPLVGYAIGFPPIKNDPGGLYVKGDYDIKEDEPFEEDYSLEDSPLPDDIQEDNL
ncbi:hypothetical protein NBRC116592_16940 [Colwellia sp. KU-HH00111]|uniref:Z1 domain-containing protein n=1 Tax=Colwellia sp. KU-HH00111 TaxID=3127652 RepID=UPI00310BA275